MSEQLTPLERALLTAFETLAQGCETSLTACARRSAQFQTEFQTMSDHYNKKILKLEQRIQTLEQGEKRMIDALNAQTTLITQWQKQSESLIQQINILINIPNK